MFVLGTAGHVDHGKSALVTALTGMEPDRLQEEKERGMTIDLGFAWLPLPSGQELSIVDVPGHERFIKNMLAGVGGIDLALLVVAADEGVMPQTREHLAILDLLQVKSGLVAITKMDLVDKEWLELVRAEVEDTLKGTTLEEAPILTVSAVTKEGIPELVRTIDDLLHHLPPKRDLGRPRLAIDRVFTVAGFGTVVTGTLVDGKLAVGQEVEILPEGLRSRVRGLQTHRRKVDPALPGSRVAVNLAGLPREQLQRGQVLTTPGWLKPTPAVDVRLQLLKDLPHPLRHHASATFFSGTTEVEARVRLLEKEKLEPGATSWAQLKLARPVPLVKGDFFILRSPETTLGGGGVVEVAARRHRRFHQPTLERLEALEKGSPADVLLKTLESQEPCEVEALLQKATFPRSEAEAALKELVAEKKALAWGSPALKSPTLLFSAAGWAHLKDKTQEILQAYHRQYPLRPGIPKEELKSRLGLSPRVFTETLAGLGEEGVLRDEGATVRLADFRIQLTPKQQAAVDTFLRALSQNSYAPPSDQMPELELLNLLIEQKKVVKVSEGVVFSAAAYEAMVKKITDRIQAQGKITVAEVRDLFNTSRKYALALMEYLDEQKMTRRVGDERVLR